MTDLRHGDCLELLHEIPDKSINLVLIDPPYNIGKEKEWDNQKEDTYIKWMTSVFQQCDRILVDNGALCWFHNSISSIAKLMQGIEHNTAFKFNSFIILDKGNFRALSWKHPSKESNLRSWFNVCEFVMCYSKHEGDSTKWDKTGWDSVRLNVENFSTLRKYAFELLCYIGGGHPYSTKQIERELGHRQAEHFFYCRPKECL